MDPRELLRRQFLEVVEEQLRTGNPPESAHTFRRLQSDGYSANDARLLIAQCVAVEMMEIFQSDTPFNTERFINNLNALPATPGQ